MLKSDLVDIGNINPNSRTRVEWEITGDPNHIVHFIPDCGCTANTRIEGNRIIADFTETDSKNLTEPNRTEWFPSRKMPITKGIWAYFNDGLDLFLLDDKGVQIVNPDKEKIKISFIGYVLLDAKRPQLTVE